jgi:hypothetical protein
MKKSCERGSIVVSILILMPLFAAILALSAAVHLTIRTDAKSRHVCRVELLRSQAKVAQHLADLLALNPRAQMLRREREIAERAWRLALTPETKAAALVTLTLVITQQTALAAQQKLLVLKGTTESRLGPARVSRQVSTSLAEDQTIYRSGAVSLGSRTSLQTAVFDIIATPSNSLTPDYQPSSTFEEKQTMRVRWQLALGPLLPRWANALLNGRLSEDVGRLKLKAECAATLRKEKSKWSPVLSAASL